MVPSLPRTMRTEIGSPGTIGAPPTPVVTIAATDANAAETGSDPGTFRITRTGSTVGAADGQLHDCDRCRTGHQRGLHADVDRRGHDSFGAILCGHHHHAG